MAGENCPPERIKMDNTKIQINHEAARLGYYGHSNNSLKQYLKQIITNEHADQVSKLKIDIKTLSTILEDLNTKYDKLKNLVKYNDFNTIKSVFKNFVIFKKHIIFIFNKWVCGRRISSTNKKLQVEKCKLQELEVNIEKKCIECEYQIQHEYELGLLAKKEQVHGKNITEFQLNEKEELQYAA